MYNQRNNRRENDAAVSSSMNAYDPERSRRSRPVTTPQTTHTYNSYPKWGAILTYLLVSIIGTVSMLAMVFVLTGYMYLANQVNSSDNRVKILKQNTKHLNELNKEMEAANEELKVIRRELERRQRQ